MALHHYSKSYVSGKVRMLINKEGKSQDQAVAMALSIARQNFRKANPGKPLPSHLRK